MTTQLTIRAEHLAITANDPLVQASLQRLKDTARTFDEIEEWMTHHLVLFGGVPLQEGDVVRVTFSPHMNTLASLASTQAMAHLDVKVTREAQRVLDLPVAFNIYNHETDYRIQHLVVTYMELENWPVITARLVSASRLWENYDKNPTCRDDLHTYFQPLFIKQFPGMTLERLHTLRASGLLETSDAMVDFLFSTRTRDATPVLTTEPLI